jgi:hypothetical protein
MTTEQRRLAAIGGCRRGRSSRSTIDRRGHWRPGCSSPPRMRRLLLRIFSFDGALGEVLVHPRSPADAIFGGLVADEVGQCPGLPGPVLPILRGP